MNARELKAHNERRAALMVRLSQPHPPTDAVSLSRSYGVPEIEVAKLIKEICRA